MIGLEGTEYGDDAPQNSNISYRDSYSQEVYICQSMKVYEEVLRQERNQNILACPNPRPCLFIP